MHLNQFPEDVQDFVYKLMLKAIRRGMKDGRWPPVSEKEQVEVCQAQLKTVNNP